MFVMLKASKVAIPPTIKTVAKNTIK
ncbi:hypothetical protein MBGDC06_00119 [Thermoplasmatales archaeon SCGC AB-539-C06]|nr:hypothetical protein MBGDC06_00119 [Thermoplasmatales archaeon SCGC AB-539-C06]